MDSISNKALIIAVGVFITLAITSGILFTLSSMKNVYKQVYETDSSLLGQFDEYDEYESGGKNNKTFFDIINAANKYMDNEKVNVYLNSMQVNNQAGVDSLKNMLDTNPNYEKRKFSASINRAIYNDTGIMNITFN